MCDRGRQVGQFNRFFKPNLSERSGLPHIYLLHGEAGQSHGSFVRRLIIDKIEPYSASKKGEMEGAVHHINPWVQPLDDLEEAKENLRFSIFEEVAPDYDPAQMSVLQLCQHRKLKPYPFVVIQHDFEVADWNAQLSMLVEWYLNTYWAEALSCARQNQILLFLNFIYPYSVRSGWHRFYPSKRFAKDAFRDFLQRLRLAVDKLYPCLLFDELGHLDQKEVCRSLAELGIHDDVDCPKWVKDLFVQKRGKVSMIDIERLIKTRSNINERARPPQ
jgi:iSTAND domain-containing protein